ARYARTRRFRYTACIENLLTLMNPDQNKDHPTHSVAKTRSNSGELSRSMVRCRNTPSVTFDHGCAKPDNAAHCVPSHMIPTLNSLRSTVSKVASRTMNSTTKI